MKAKVLPVNGSGAGLKGETPQTRSAAVIPPVSRKVQCRINTCYDMAMTSSGCSSVSYEESQLSCVRNDLPTHGPTYTCSMRVFEGECRTAL